MSHRTKSRRRVCSRSSINCRRWIRTTAILSRRTRIPYLGFLLRTCPSCKCLQKFSLKVYSLVASWNGHYSQLKLSSLCGCAQCQRRWPLSSGRRSWTNSGRSSALKTPNSGAPRSPAALASTASFPVRCVASLARCCCRLHAPNSSFYLYLACHCDQRPYPHLLSASKPDRWSLAEEPGPWAPGIDLVGPPAPIEYWALMCLFCISFALPVATQDLSGTAASRRSTCEWAPGMRRRSSMLPLHLLLLFLFRWTVRPCALSFSDRFSLLWSRCDRYRLLCATLTVLDSSCLQCDALWSSVRVAWFCCLLSVSASSCSCILHRSSPTQCPRVRTCRYQFAVTGAKDVLILIDTCAWNMNTGTLGSLAAFTICSTNAGAAARSGSRSASWSWPRTSCFRCSPIRTSSPSSLYAMHTPRRAQLLHVPYY